MASVTPAPASASEVAIPWIMRLRYSMAAGQFLAAWAASHFVDVDLPLERMAVAPVLTVISNLWLRGHRGAVTIFLVFVFDIWALTTQLLLAGGPNNPFSLLYLVHITLASVLLSNRQTWVLAGFSMLCFGSLFWQYRPIPALEVHNVDGTSSVHLTGMWLGFSVTASLVAMFSTRISGLLREREASLLRMQEELAKKDRLASLVTLAAGAAHELGTPLSTIAVVARELERFATQTAPSPAVAEDSRLIRTEVDRCRAILERLSIEGAEPAGEPLIDVSVSDIITTIRNRFANTPTVRVDASNASAWPSIRIPLHAVEQALIALVKNAVEASPAESLVTLHVAPGPDTVRFIVTDRGHGMSQDILRHVGEPFFTTKETGKGMGLGTFLVRTLAERLGGSLVFHSTPSSGTTAIFELPAISAVQKKIGSFA
jgi:two-component system, sensor histidine kinase RegB